MAAIELQHLSKRFPDGTEAVRDAHFRIEDGEFFILVGPSGCGKSTLLNLLAGLETPSAGEIRVDGRRIDDVDPRHRNMAMVFQSYALYPHMSVRQNLAFPLELAKVPAAEMAQRVEEAARILGLEGELDRRPGQLSGGQRQRVAMGRAIVREPVAFLMDEPLSNLDAKLRVQMRSEVRRLQRRLGTTTVYVTHDQTEAMTLGDRIAVMRRGAVEQVGTPRALYEDPANLFVAGFIGSPGMNFLPAERRGERLVLPMTELPLRGRWRETLQGGEVPLVLGVRPEHLREAGESSELRAGCFRARIELVEWLGSELYAHFRVDAPRATELTPLYRELELEGRDEAQLELVARLAPTSRAREGEEIELCVDADAVHLFDGRTGMRLGSSSRT